MKKDENRVKGGVWGFCEECGADTELDVPRGDMINMRLRKAYGRNMQLAGKPAISSAFDQVKAMSEKIIPENLETPKTFVLMCAEMMGALVTLGGAIEAETGEAVDLMRMAAEIEEKRLDEWQKNKRNGRK